MEWSLGEIFLAVTAGLLVGLSKTGIPAAILLAIPIMALLFPAKLSVGALLPLLLVGDILAIKYYRYHAKRTELIRLAPGTLVGMVVGALFLSEMNNAFMERMLGALVLLLLALEGLRAIFPARALADHRVFPWFFGTLAGIATTMGNAAGPIVGLYLLGRSLPKEAFMGTAAWFFLAVNCLKVPLFVSLGMITGESLTFDAMLIPAILLGGWIGPSVLAKLSQSLFNRLILILSAVAGLQLLMGA
ncbi:MAG: hypothetical protein BECKG1743D_GA0114223_101444 [Candidatus Kentron sp. G]|nr:MAG: hypothetical protein BECKG1743F_GA0114225_102124 [Candidatus Kentron sp. G]VFM97218.1 MAG: hypothetical protein BECKG1743E_GA0114224_101194 [Candidatus Kentron sp. G]VFM99763.1 MAG: hypothetical protein BECKG1743D_GA0114223_101444 [Candidatus Kentron sp. G]